MDGLQLIRKQETQDNNINLVTGEVTNARTNADPFDYDNLKQRLDAMDRNLTSAIEGLEWKPSVPTFGDIAATYPNPEEGWTVSVDDTNEIFRYDETLGQWISIMTSFSTATQTAPGLMSAEDKKKLDGLNSANYVHKNGDVMTGNLTMTNNGKFIGDLEGNSATTGRLQNPVQINGVNFDGSMNIDITDDSKLPLTGGTLTGVLNANAGVVGNVTGNASTATKLQVERTINGVPFDGSKNIVIEDNTKLPLAGGTITGNLKVDGTITGNLNGNATSSSKLQTPRNINGVPFDGTGDINIAISQGTDVTLGGYNKPGVGGNVNAGDNINQAIGKLEVNLDGKANAVHNHSSNEVVSMNGYAISTTGGAIAPGDSLNTAIGKLEYEIKNKSVSNMTLSGYTKPNSTSPIAPGDTINQAIGKLEYGLDQKAPLVHNQPSNTINALTGYVLAGNNGAITTNDTLNVALAKLENNANGKAPLNHNQGSNTINTMAGYNKGAVGGAITQGDTLNSAIGKLEVNLDGKANGNHTHPYLPLTGGNLTGDVNTTRYINFTVNNMGIQHNGNLILGNNGASTVLSSINSTIFFRPGGYAVSANQATLDVNGNFAATKFIGNLQGNADTATRLQTGRRINGVLFDGTGDINIGINPANVNLNGYVKPNQGGAITSNDSLNSAFGKLEVNLDGKANTNHTHTSNNVTALTGYVKGTAGTALTVNDSLNTALSKIEVRLDGKANTNHTHTSNNITGMTGYAKPNTTSAIVAGDSLNVAIGKLEFGLDGKANTNHLHDNRYLQLTGGTLTGNVNTNSSINFTNPNTGCIRVNNNLVLRNNGTSTVLSSINNTMYFRPQGDSIATNQATLDTNGNFAATKFIGNLQGNADTATRLQTPRTINGVAFDGTTNITIADNTKVAKAGDTMTGALNNNLHTGTYLAGNQGKALVNSTNAAGGYTTLLKSNSTNGYFTVNSFQGNLLVGYTAKTTVDGGTNRLDRQITLLNEAGNTTFPGQVTATTFNGNATSATRLQNARTIQLTGAVTGQANFDGSANIQINTTLATQQKGRLVRLTSRVVVNTTTKTVNIGIGAFNVNNDVLNVYLSGVRLEPTVDYTNTQSQITLTGTNNFVNGDVVSFEVIQMQ